MTTKASSKTQTQSGSPFDNWEDSDSIDVDAFWDIEECHKAGGYLHGLVRGAFSIEQDDGVVRTVIVTELKEDMPWGTNRNQAVELKAGDMVGVGINSKLDELKYYVGTDAEYMVKPLEKVPTNKSGRKMWKFDLKFPPGEKKKKNAEPWAPRSGDVRTPSEEEAF